MKPWILLIAIIIGVAGISNATPILDSYKNWKWADGQATVNGVEIETGAPSASVPASATMALFGFGLISLAGLGRRLNKKKTGD